MKRSAIAALALVAIASPAWAADLAVAPARVSPATNWSGFYVGALGGYAAQTDSGSLKGPLAGGTLGYNFQSGAIVAGIEADAAWSDIKETLTVPGITATDKVLATGTVRGRIGVAFDSLLIYGTGGYAWADNQMSITVLGVNFKDTQLHSGWTGGAGFEFLFAPRWSLKAEYLYRSYASQNYFSNVVAGGVSSGKLAVNSVQVGVNFHF